MTPPPADPAAQIRSLGARTRWELVDQVRIAGDVGHPQGLMPWGDRWLATTVFPDAARGEVLVIDADGRVDERVDVTDGERIHPGGIAVSDGTDGGFVAVAEYRPRSTTVIAHLAADATVTTVGVVEDHIGALAAIGDGTFVALTWGSRDLLRLDADARVVERRPNASHFVDHQDLSLVGDVLVATGIGWVPQPGALAMLGGLAVIDVDRLQPTFETPVHAWMPSGRVATYNGCHLEADAEVVRLHCLVDDTDAAIGRWEVGPDR